jgi:hypothetical protein
MADLLDLWCKECSKSADHKVTWKYIEGQNGKASNDTVTACNDINRYNDQPLVWCLFGVHQEHESGS